MSAIFSAPDTHFDTGLLGVHPFCVRNTRLNVAIDPKPTRSATCVTGRSLWLSISAAISTRRAFRYWMNVAPVCRLNMRLSV